MNIALQILALIVAFLAGVVFGQQLKDRAVLLEREATTKAKGDLAYLKAKLGAAGVSMQSALSADARKIQADIDAWLKKL